MTEINPYPAASVDRSLLYVAELQHRINNEYAKAISYVSRLAAFSSVPEAKAALLEVANHLYATSRIYHVLRPPLPGSLTDFTAHIGELCGVFTSAGLEQRGIGLEIAISGSAMIEAMRSWRASLIMAELITNSVRHACLADAGRIRVSVAAGHEAITCEVGDDGAPVGAAKRGVGSHLIDALADELGACIIRSYTDTGAVVTLCFPKIAER